MVRPTMLASLCFLMLALSACPTHAASVTVNASDPEGTINSALFGLSQAADQHGSELWNHAATPTRIKDQPKYLIQQAINDKAATVRFPGGHLSEVYRWRRAVGWPVSSRPKTKGYYGEEVINDFGTDELAMSVTPQVRGFLEDISPYLEPIMITNWWYFNDPNNVPQGVTPEEFAAWGMQEASNWVDYCNQEVTQAIINQANSEGWQPSTFIDPETELPSTDKDAIESANGTTSWLSYGTHDSGPNDPPGYYNVPQGYFGWLRYRIAQLRGEQDSGPYGIRYWEVGTEIAAKFWEDQNLTLAEAEQYRESVVEWCQAIKKRNDTSHQITITDTTVHENSPFQGRYIQIGASMDDWADLHRAPFGQMQFTTIVPDKDDPIDHGLGAWDTAVLNSGSSKFIDFVVLHPGAGYIDWRYSNASIPAGYTWIQAERTPPLDLSLTEGVTYHFYVRAKASPAGSYPDYYPKMEAKLVGGMTIGLKAVSPANRVVSDERFVLKHPETGSQAYTTYDPRTDYHFSTEGRTVPTGAYRLQIEHPSGAQGGAGSFSVSMVTYKPDGGSETVVEFDSPSNQTAAVLAAPVVLGSRLDALQAHLNSFSPKEIELRATGWGYGWTLTAYPDQVRNLKGLLAITDFLRELMDKNVDSANYVLNRWFTHAVQPQGTWDALQHTTLNRDSSGMTFFHSPVGQMFSLMTHHFGTGKVGTTVSSDTFSNPEYDSIPAMGTGTPYDPVPYVTALGSRTMSGASISKVSVLIINKGSELTNTPVKITHLDADGAPTGLCWHTLKCWDTSLQGDAVLDAQNSVDFKDRVSVRTEYAAVPGWSYSADDGWYVNLSRTLPARSITLVELFVRDPVTLEVGDALKAPNDWSVKLADKHVSAVFGDYFYIQDPNRTAGIKVHKQNHGRSVCDRVSVTGTLATVDGERTINVPPPPPDLVTFHGTVPEVRPLGMRNEWLGGESPSANTPPVKDGFGFYNVGLLAQSWGVVLSDPGSNYFYIYDGSNLWDGSGCYGVRVEISPVPAWIARNDYVRVAGITGTKQLEPNGPYVRVLRPRDESDIALVDFPTNPPGINLSSGWNFLSLPGIPEGAGPETVFAGCTGGIALDGKLKRYDPFVPAWVYFFLCPSETFGNCLVGEGYGLNINESDNHCYNYMRADVTGDQLISLPVGSDPKEAFCLIGNPFDANKAWSSIKVLDGSSLRTLPDAVALGVIYEIKSWNGTSWVTVDNLAGNMEARKAYVVYPQKNNLALIIPG